VQAETNVGCAPCAAISTAAPSPASTEATLHRAYVHVARYYRAWLAGTAGGEALADALAVEALVRIAHLREPPEDSDDAELIAAWLSVAHEVAREVVEG